MEIRIRIIRILMLFSIFYSLVFSVIGHWLVPDFYYITLMGHTAYQDSMVKLSGIYGILTAALAFYVFRRPVKNGCHGTERKWRDPTPLV